MSYSEENSNQNNSEEQLSLVNQNESDPNANNIILYS